MNSIVTEIVNIIKSENNYIKRERKIICFFLNLFKEIMALALAKVDDDMISEMKSRGYQIEKKNERSINMAFGEVRYTRRRYVCPGRKPRYPLDEFYAKWNKAYSRVIQELKAIESDLLVFYNYPKQIRASIYSTNMIESFNNIIKRKAKPKAEFPTEQSLDTFIGIQAMSYNSRYFNRIHKGFGQVQDTLESYFD